MLGRNNSRLVTKDLATLFHSLFFFFMFFTFGVKISEELISVLASELSHGACELQEVVSIVELPSEFVH
jgi:hypothetical protein